MKKIDPADITAKTLALLCAIAIFGGGTSLILGSSGSIFIWTGDRLKPHQRTFRFLGFYGGLFCGGGFLLVGTASAILQGATQRAIAQEKSAATDLEFWQHPVSPAETTAYSVCQRCHHYHGQAYGGFSCLRNASVRVEWGNCPDFRIGELLNPTEDRFL